MTRPNPKPTIPNANQDRDALVNEFLDLQESLEKKKILLAQLADRIVDELGVGNRWELLPGVGVRVQKAAAVFNADKAKEVLTDDQYAAICELKPSAKKAEKVLPGMVVDLCRVTGKPSVRSL